MGLTYKENVPDTREFPVRESLDCQKKRMWHPSDVWTHESLIPKEELLYLNATELIRRKKYEDFNVIRECENQNLDYFILHTGQHYSYNLDRIFFDELELPEAKYNLDVGSGSHAEEINRVLADHVSDYLFAPTVF
jgi:UDP-N-acetylglucosamine 2-epimerase (non-hydrolysing)